MRRLQQKWRRAKYNAQRAGPPRVGPFYMKHLSVAIASVVALLLPVLLFAAPPTPLNVRAENSERGGVVVHWQRPTLGLVLNYDIYRSTRATSLGTRIAREIAGEEFLDTKAEANKTYYYAVKSVDQSGVQSAPSGGTIITVKDLVPPPPPSKVRVTVRDSGEVKVSWSKPSGEKITGYAVYRSVSSGTLGDLRIRTAKTSYAEYSLPGGSTYYYTVKAIDAGGNFSPESEQLRADVINSNDAPLSVANAAATATGRSGEVKISWKRPSSSNLSYIRLYRSTSSSDRGAVVAGNVRGSSYADRNLTDGVTYYYTIETVSKGGAAYASAATLSVSPFAKSKASSPPPPVRSARAADRGDGRSIMLSWVNPDAPRFRQIRIYRSTDADERGGLIASGVRLASYTDAKNLESDTRYFYTIATVGDAGIETSEPAVVSGIPTLALSAEGAGSDSDGDGLPDAWERQYGYHPRAADDPAQDDDGDGLGLLDEYRYGSSPWDHDSDDDGHSDGTEVANGYSPTGAGRLVVRPVAQTLSVGSFAYGVARLSSVAEEEQLAANLKRLLEVEFGRGRIPNPRRHWHTFVNAYIYGGYSASEIAHTLRFGPGLVHPSVPAAEWRQTDEYRRKGS